MVRAAAIAAAGALYVAARALMPQQDSPLEGKEEYCVVERVIDGDTLKLAGGKRVRLIGVDTPEKHYSEKLVRDARRSGKDIRTIRELGEKAAQFTGSICEGKKVRLEYDVERRDKYKRHLAYAYLEDGTFLNAKIIEEGYGQVMTIPPNVRHASYFLKLQQEARKGKRGLWEDKRGQSHFLQG